MEKLYLQATFTSVCGGITHVNPAWCAHDAEGRCWGREPTKQSLRAYISMTNRLVKSGQWASRPWLVLK